jgi:type VI secretion system secreted protein VgrG
VSDMTAAIATAAAPLQALAGSAASGASTATPFELDAGSCAAGELAVVSFRGREQLSRLFRLDAVVSTDAADADGLQSALLGQPFCLRVAVPGEDGRVFQGIVAKVEAMGVHAHGPHVCRLGLVPSAWLLKQRKNSRVFQDQTVADIVRAILGEHQLTATWTLTKTYAPRTYCVQYQETDYAFVARLLADEGISFYADTTDQPVQKALPGQLVLFDDSTLAPPIAGSATLAFRSDDGSQGVVAQEGSVFRFVTHPPDA